MSLNSSKIALVTGITGQDGSHLAEFLLGLGYEVHGVIRRSSNFNTSRIEHVYNRLHLHYGDLSSSNSIFKLMNSIQPDEVYNLGCMSHVRVSFDDPEYVMDVGATGTVRILEAIRSVRETSGKDIRFYQASSSEMFGSTPPPQNEQTIFHPRSPYACAKVAAYHLTVNYREAYGIHASNGILFNHEGPRRGETFVTRKITRAATRIKLGKQKVLKLGNIEAKRDWGYAGDYVEAMWMMVNHKCPDDYVVATGESHSVREFLEEAFGCLDLDWHKYVEIDSRYIRPSEVDDLRGDPSKIKNNLGWKPKVDFKSLVKMMIDNDLELARKDNV